MITNGQLTQEETHPFSLGGVSSLAGTIAKLRSKEESAGEAVGAGSGGTHGIVPAGGVPGRRTYPCLLDVQEGGQGGVDPSGVDGRDRVPRDASLQKRILGGDALRASSIHAAHEDRAAFTARHRLSGQDERSLTVMALKELHVSGDEGFGGGF
jgi:hypothetical protein